MVRRILLSSCFFLSSFAAAQNKRPFTFEDMMKLKRVAEPYLSPDGKWAAFSVTDVSLEENKKTNHIWIVPVAGEKRDNSPAEGRRRRALLAGWQADPLHLVSRRKLASVGTGVSIRIAALSPASRTS